MVACLFAVLVVASARAVVQCLAPSSGCLASNGQRLQSGSHRIDVNDPFIGNISRRFVLWASSTHHANAGGIQHHASPLLLGFHAQKCDPEELSKSYPAFIDLADKHGYTLVYLAALVEAYWDNSTNKQQFGSSWNVGNAGDNYTCLPATNDTVCTESCQRLAKCGSCNFATCYSDTDALKQLLRHLEKELCLDTSRYYMFGVSNGGMFIHSVLQEMPGRFLAAAPIFGSPLLGYLARFRHQLVWEQQLLSKTSVMQFHDRSDTVIPWQGGKDRDGDGWLYEPMVRVMDAWSAVHECVKYPIPLTTPESGGPDHVECMQFANCSLGGCVAYCLYNGEHGYVPLPAIANMVYDFFESVHSSNHESNVKMAWWSYWSRFG